MKTLIRQSIHNPIHEMQTQLMSVCSLLNWTPDVYCGHQLEQYEEFLRRMFWGFPEEMLNEVRYSSIMSGFWKNEWYQRNRVDFIQFAADLLETTWCVDQHGELVLPEPAEDSLATVMDEHLWIHSSKRLVNDENFMAQYNHALKLIRLENRKNLITK